MDFLKLFFHLHYTKIANRDFSDNRPADLCTIRISEILVQQQLSPDSDCTDNFTRFVTSIKLKLVGLKFECYSCIDLMYISSCNWH